MEHALTEFPLALFTTLAPAGAGAFVLLAIALFSTSFSEEQLRKLDKLSFVPLIVVAVGLVASFVHLASPGNVFHVFANVGVSPLSNEIVAGVVFGIIALVYCIMAAAGKLSKGARKGFAAVTALAALVFVFFTGMAYSIETVPTWYSPYTPLEIIGICLFGGTLLGALILKGSGAYQKTNSGGIRQISIVMVLLGLALALFAVCSRFFMADSLSNAQVSGAALTSALTIYLILFVVLMLIAALMGIVAMLKNGSTFLFVSGTIVALVAICIGRLLFYALQISVGLQAF